MCSPKRVRSMRRDDQRLGDILEALDWIARVLGAKTEADFMADETLRHAVARHLTIVGEAAGRLSSEVRSRDSSVNWREIVGLRNVLVHDYFGIFWPTVWRAATVEGPVLRERIAALLDQPGLD